MGLRSFSILDKGGWYKITNMTVLLRAEEWYMNDLTIECKDKNADLLQRYRQIINISPTKSCSELTFDLNINIKNLTGEKDCTLVLGQGRIRNGRTLLVAEGTVDLPQYVVR
jgi:hypothetical protein